MAHKPHPTPTALSVPFSESSRHPTIGLSWMNVRKEKVYVIVSGVVVRMDLAEWSALCDEAPEDVSHLPRDYRVQRRIPFSWFCVVDLFSVPIGETAVGPWLISGPDYALLKRIPDDARVAWRQEAEEASAWIRANQAAKPIGPGYLYLTRRTDGRGPVKLGFSREPEKRAGRLKSAYGLRHTYHVIAKRRGTDRDERALHRALRDFRIERKGSREWYRPTPDVLTCLDVLLPVARQDHDRRSHRASFSTSALIRGFQPGALPVKRVKVLSAGNSRAP